jgi:hypothetical protein
MRKEYDFSKSVKNPYAKKTGIPYQNLINLYLGECAHSGKKPSLKWAS